MVSRTGRRRVGRKRGQLQDDRYGCGRLRRDDHWSCLRVFLRLRRSGFLLLARGRDGRVLLYGLYLYWKRGNLFICSRLRRLVCRRTGDFVRCFRLRRGRGGRNTGDKIAGATGGCVKLRARRKPGGRNTGDEIAGVTGGCVKLRAGRKPGGRAEALAPRSGRCVQRIRRCGFAGELLYQLGEIGRRPLRVRLHGRRTG